MRGIVHIISLRICHKNSISIPLFRIRIVHEKIGSLINIFYLYG